MRVSALSFALWQRIRAFLPQMLSLAVAWCWLRGVEDRCLVLFLRWHPRIGIPGSSHGDYDVAPVLENHATFVRHGINA